MQAAAVFSGKIRPMADIVLFKKPKPSQKHRGNTLCRSGFHKWELLKDSEFDNKSGRLVTVYRCRRCGQRKNTAI